MLSNTKFSFYKIWNKIFKACQNYLKIAWVYLLLCVVFQIISDLFRETFAWNIFLLAYFDPIMNPIENTLVRKVHVNAGLSVEITSLTKGRNATKEPTVTFSIRLVTNWNTALKGTTRITLRINGSKPGKVEQNSKSGPKPKKRTKTPKVDRNPEKWTKSHKMDQNSEKWIKLPGKYLFLDHRHTCEHGIIYCYKAFGRMDSSKEVQLHSSCVARGRC